MAARSECWKYFDIVPTSGDEEEMTKCKLCLTNLSYKHHNTSSMLKHMEFVHKLKLVHVVQSDEPTKAKPVTSVSKQTTLLQYTNKVHCIAKTWSRMFMFGVYYSFLVHHTRQLLRSWSFFV